MVRLNKLRGIITTIKYQIQRFAFTSIPSAVRLLGRAMSSSATDETVEDAGERARFRGRPVQSNPSDEH